MPKLADSQEVASGIIRHMIKSSAFAVLVARFLEKQAESIIAKEMNLEQDRIYEKSVKEEVMVLSSLVSCSLKSSYTTEGNKKEEKKDSVSSYHHSKLLSCSRRSSSLHSDDYEVEKNNEERNRVQV